MNFIGIIPARYASTRFPGKPLADMAGKPMIQRVYEQANQALEHVYVATDDSRIFDAVKNFGGNAVMTGNHHQSGTDRCYEAFLKISSQLSTFNFQLSTIINIQGDEPFIQPAQIEVLKNCFSDTGTQIASLVKPFTETDDIEALLNPNSPKVVLNEKNEALYFSRSVIPFLRGVEQKEWLAQHIFYKHIGLYGYRADVLEEITALPQSSLEKAESLEQLRWLQNGYRIKMGITTHETIGIDTPEDMAQAIDFLNYPLKRTRHCKEERQSASLRGTKQS
ncbi:MAG: 3-deoxy-manno-octulosonate cytidylyltransferase [Prevotellaceae bacterium]|jgi:3-deoxy-manno-octulosonate cytidylyltransferase (CMP-KDO synthetase)|nr:3-deoxy-manno-octulosonate cytidylyltransferase [Prevotellaceae bacterium]